jgi:hypothetical protein
MLRRLAFVAVLGVVACASGTRRRPELEGQTLYTCCNLVFNQGRYASDANYAYGDGNIVGPGTRVRVVDASDDEVTFQPENGSSRFTLFFKFGTDHIAAREFFASVLVRDDPRAALAGAPPEVVAAVRRATIVPGMTRAQAIIARGYPPRHRTASLESDDWLYYRSAAMVEHVHFVDGHVASVVSGPASQAR